MLTTSDATRLVTDLYGRWIQCLMGRQFDWLERHLASDFLFTAQPFPTIRMNKHEFIEADKKIENARISFVSIAAEPIEDIIISRAIADVEETFHADLGPGMPTAEEITRAISGQRIAYCSGWRHTGEIWECFDHHVIGLVARR